MGTVPVRAQVAGRCSRFSGPACMAGQYNRSDGLSPHEHWYTEHCAFLRADSSLAEDIPV